MTGKPAARMGDMTVTAALEKAVRLTLAENLQQDAGLVPELVTLLDNHERELRSCQH